MGGGVRTTNGRWLYAPLPASPSLKGRGRIFLGCSAILMPMGLDPAILCGTEVAGKCLFRNCGAVGMAG
jgi:hypothetical protein